MPTLELVEDRLTKAALAQFPDAERIERVSERLNSVVAPYGLASRMAAVRVSFADGREDQYVYEPIVKEV